MECTVTYKGINKNFNVGTTYYDIACSYDVDHPIVVKIGQELFSLADKITKSSDVEFLSVNHISGYKIYQAGLKYLFLVAVKELYPNADVRFLHSVPKGILCEIFLSTTLNQEDISKIKCKMAKLVNEKEKFVSYHLKPWDAYNYMISNGLDEKSRMVLYSSSDLITMYRLKDNFNYFYNLMPYDTSVLDLFDIHYLGDNRVVLVTPSMALDGKVPEYVNNENIINNFMDSQKWLRVIGKPYLANINELISSNKISDFINMNELMFQKDIINACDTILKNKKVKFVLIAGPSSSGKTTTMKRLATCFKARGLEPITLSTDDFFVDKINTPKNDRGEYDFECLQAVDLELFNDTLNKLLDNQCVQVPTYDFVAGKKIFKGDTISLKENSIVLIEGLHCLNDDLLPYIPSEYKYKIYLSPFMPLAIDRHNYISTLDLRLIRRLVRDKRDRAREVFDTISSWQLVREGEEKYIFPYVHQANKVINTSLSYELGVLKVYALPLLYSVELDSPYYGEARRLIKVMNSFFTINSELVPKDSIIREFIG